MGESLTARSAAFCRQGSTVCSCHTGSLCTGSGACVTDSFLLPVRRADPVMRIGLFLSVIAGTVDEKHSEEVPTCNTTFPEVGMKKPTRQTRLDLGRRRTSRSSRCVSWERHSR